MDSTARASTTLWTTDGRPLGRDQGEAPARRGPITVRAGRRSVEDLIGVPWSGDRIGMRTSEVGDYGVARMAPEEFERFIETVRRADPR